MFRKATSAAARYASRASVPESMVQTRGLAELKQRMSELIPGSLIYSYCSLFYHLEMFLPNMPFCVSNHIDYSMPSPCLPGLNFSWSFSNFLSLPLISLLASFYYNAIDGLLHLPLCR